VPPFLSSLNNVTRLAAAFAGIGHMRLRYPRGLYGAEQRRDSRLRHRLTRSLGGKRRLIEPQPSRIAKRSSSLRRGKDAADLKSMSIDLSDEGYRAPSGSDRALCRLLAFAEEGVDFIRFELCLGAITASR